MKECRFECVLQEWECRRRDDGTLRMYKCRGDAQRFRLPLNDSIIDDVIGFELAEDDHDDEHDFDVDEYVSNVSVRCECDVMMPQAMSRSEVRRQSRFLNKHVQSGESLNSI